jgi:DNA repair exonuclease SbcCD nuclease subunit
MIKMIKTLVIGDPHFKVNNTNEMDIMSNDIINIAKEKQPDFIVVLGDVLDKHESIHVIPLMQSIDFLKQLQDIAPLYVLMGNHDRPNNQDFLSSSHPFTALKYWNNTTIIDTSQTITIKDCVFTFVPYVYKGRFKEALEKTNYKQSSVIFCHQEFKNVIMGAKKSMDGDVWNDDDPYIISGHIHDMQLLQNNIFYIGTPIQHKFGEKEDKFIALFHFKNNITYKHHNIVYDKIKLKVPLKKIVHLQPEQLTSFVFEKNINYKIIIHCEPNDIKLLSKHPKILQFINEGAQVFYKNKPPTSVQNNVMIDHHVDFMTLLQQDIQHNTNLLSLYNEILTI